ncbi:hypothetical protein C8R43DRAFT_869456, partial [Mycena crocata]
ALFDSAESFPQPRCHPQARMDILNGLYGWFNCDSTCSMRWLYGPAGAGKSAIMQSLFQRLQVDGRLGAGFCFKRGHPTRGNTKVLFATLAYQLALQNSVLEGSISQAVRKDTSIVGRSMDAQLQALIVKPCESFRDRNLHVPILLIDGLDECEGQTVQQELLCLITDAIAANPDIVRILVASRQEPHIWEILEKPSLNPMLCHSLNIDQSFTDVERYLRDEFSRIHRNHRETMREIETPWPPSYILNLLVEKSSGYFIYASTVVKFVDDSDFRPADRLAAIVKNVPNSSDLQPFEALDMLYTQILQSVPARLRLVRILCVFDKFKHLSLGDIEQLLELRQGDVRLSLQRLHSLLQVPLSDDQTIAAHHASFWDFLADPSRSGEFCVNTLQRHNELTRSVLRVLSHNTTDVRFPLTSDRVAWCTGSSLMR